MKPYTLKVEAVRISEDFVKLKESKTSNIINVDVKYSYIDVHIGFKYKLVVMGNKIVGIFNNCWNMKKICELSKVRMDQIKKFTKGDLK